MHLYTVFAFLAAGAIGWRACRVVHRRYEEELEQRVKEAGESLESHRAVIAMVHRSVLQMLKTGDLDGAKEELSETVLSSAKTEPRRESEEGGSAFHEPYFVRLRWAEEGF